MALAAALGWTGAAAAPLSATEVLRARQAAMPKLAASAAGATGHAPKLRLAGVPTWSDPGPAHRALMLAMSTPVGARDAECRLVTLPADLSSAQVVDAADMPDCRGIGRVLFVDVNGDGRLDVIAGLKVPSNRYDVVVDVPAVFLSDATAAAGWCYSQQASDHLQPDDLASPTRARDALAREQARLRLPRFACGRP